MSQARPDHKQIEGGIREVERKVARAREVRKKYARRRTPRRDSALRDARTGCAAAVKPLRSWLGMVAWGGITLDDELAMKAAVAAARYERRQIDKML